MSSAIVADIVRHFRCFGGNQDVSKSNNPISHALKDRPAEFAAGVSVADVVKFVLAGKTKPRPLSEWHEDYGNVLWWIFPLSEPPYCGSPLDLGRDVLVEVSVGAFHGSESKTVTFHIEGWPGYHTHWTPIEVPETPADEVAKERAKNG